MNYKKILLLAAHPDDLELSSGGSIHRWARMGMDIHSAVFSPCVQSLPDGYTKEDIYREFDSAMEQLGIPLSNISKFNFPVREFPKNRQEILEKMILLKKSISPELVLMPNPDDIHQDHHQIFLEGVRAFKNASILGYELPWNSLQFKSNFHINLEQEDIDAKMSALKCYKSQSHRNYFSNTYVESSAKFRGLQINEKYAECFQLVRWIIR